ncbi:MAG TPA: hypothetical protein VNM67_24070 [Thermoanaerobaculia bacterium]|nr:hypothetical protein [Thermoanaerobaculia bacterium]
MVGDPVFREMTVASIRERPEADSVRVAFLESARFYELPRAHPGFDRILARLREAKEQGRVLKVRLPSLDSGVIEDVDASRL